MKNICGECSCYNECPCGRHGYCGRMEDFISYSEEACCAYDGPDNTEEDTIQRDNPRDPVIERS
jgi:hypothetical protein